MPSIACISPSAMRRALEATGYKLIDEDSYNWIFARDEREIPIVLPHRIKLLPVDIMNRLYWGQVDLREKIFAELEKRSGN